MRGCEAKSVEIVEMAGVFDRKDFLKEERERSEGDCKYCFRRRGLKCVKFGIWFGDVDWSGSMKISEKSAEFRAILWNCRYLGR